MAFEDFTEYTEVDTASCITITAAKINVVNCPTRYSENYVYKDFGANHFNADFTHKFTLYSNNWSSGVVPVLWIMSNIVDIPYNIRTANADYLGLWLTTDDKLYLYEGVSGAEYNDSYSTGGSPFTLYITIKRDMNVGTYGTLYCFIHSDADRTTLLDTLSITLHKSSSFRYLFPFSGYSLGSVGYFWSGYIENLEFLLHDIYVSTDTQFAFREQSAWGTAEADSSEKQGILTEGYGINSQINFVNFLNGRAQRYSNASDVRVNQKGVVYETEKFKTPAIKTQLDFFLYAIFQNVVETANGANYQKTFTFPLMQPDFTVNDGKFFTVWAQQPVSSTSQKINDSLFSELTLSCSPESEGILWIDNLSYLARNHSDIANPSGTINYPDISEFFFYDLTTAQINSTEMILNNLIINIKNNAKRIGIDSGKFKTFCLPRYEIELQIQMLYGTLAQTLMGYAKNGTAVNFEFQWGSANSDGYLNISGNAKISQAINLDRQDLNYINVNLYCCGEYGVTEPFQIEMINSENRGW